MDPTLVPSNRYFFHCGLSHAQIGVLAVRSANRLVYRHQRLLRRRRFASFSYGSTGLGVAVAISLHFKVRTSLSRYAEETRRTSDDIYFRKPFGKFARVFTKRNRRLFDPCFSFSLGRTYVSLSLSLSWFFGFRTKAACLFAGLFERSRRRNAFVTIEHSIKFFIRSIFSPRN